MEKDNDGGGERADPPPPVYQSLLETRAYTLQSVVAITLFLGAVVYIVGLLLAHDYGVSIYYLRSGSVYFALFGALAGTGALLTAGIYHLRIWRDVRQCFAVSDETYSEVVDPVLKRAHSPGWIGVELLLALPVVLVVDGIIAGIPPAVLPGLAEGPCLSPEFGGICMSNRDGINYLYGLVVLFVVVAGVHGVIHFLWLVIRVTDLPLSDIHTAADRLEPVARFSVFVATCLFGGAIALVIPYVYLTVYVPPVDTLVEFLAVVPGSAVVVVLNVVGLTVMGFFVFWIPQLSIHNALETSKRDRIASINDDYRSLREECRTASESVERISAELEVIEAQRRNAKEIPTWSYNLPTLLPFVGSGVLSIVTWLSQLMNQIGLV